ncbi:hypothetical protein GEV33_007773 [Tenebrio molitor]|uniref:Uncharacterized protein n=1 Tax=Tenebrio molitor TaxID=7067 RepID=A0A8J6LCR8_TENMO|nr:hypothetical protein GEV33_007773 [Tenebrio molitor]
MRQGDASIGGWINLANKQDVRYIGCIQKRSVTSAVAERVARHFAFGAWYGSLSTYYHYSGPIAHQDDARFGSSIARNGRMKSDALFFYARGFCKPGTLI